jgi:hypothetical protein
MASIEASTRGNLDTATLHVTESFAPNVGDPICAKARVGHQNTETNMATEVDFAHRWGGLGYREYR